TSTSPSRGPSRSTSMISSGLPAATATAARVFISRSLVRTGRIYKKCGGVAYSLGGGGAIAQKDISNFWLSEPTGGGKEEATGRASQSLKIRQVYRIICIMEPLCQSGRGHRQHLRGRCTGRSSSRSRG